MNMRTFTIAVGGIGLALLAASVVMQMDDRVGRSTEIVRLDSADFSTGAKARSIDLLVFTSPLPAGHRIGPGDLAISSTGLDRPSVDQVLDARKAIGQVLLVPVAKGDPVHASCLTPAGGGPSIASQLGPLDRAATVVLGDLGSKVMLYPGARVDVVATAPIVGTGGARRLASRTILEDRLVLAVDDEVAGGSVDLVDDSGRRRASPRSVTVTLAVRAGEGELLALASEQGVVGLVLRPLQGETAGDSSVITSESLFGTVAASPSEIEDRPTAPTRPEMSGGPSAEESAADRTDRSWWEILVVRGTADLERVRVPFEGR